MSDESPSKPLFRPSKKRKTYRQRDVSPPALEQPGASSTSPNDKPTSLPPRDTSHDEGDDRDDRAGAALRIRNRKRAGGVGFTTNNSSTSTGADATSAALVPSRAAQDGDASAAAVVHGMNNFTHQTGLVSSLNDKHMTEYIESRLSRRSQPDDLPSTPQKAPTNTITNTQTTQQRDPSAKAPSEQTLQGRLLEVDLSAIPTRQRNNAPTPGQPSIAAPPKKQRLGPDGKPWRGGRRRRGSDDVKRDQLVEAFLHENRLDVYEPPPPEPTNDDPSGDLDARLAEQFQKQYMDDQARRRQQQQKKKPGTAQEAGAAAAGGDEVLKGPKLGGSRNARAAVRDALLKKEKEGRK